jgi:iron complex outermembrane receptor protein
MVQVSRHRLALYCGAAAVLWAGHAATQAAQGSSTQPTGTVTTSGADGRVSEVVITAERRTVNLQQAAVAADVLSGTDLANKGVMRVDDLQSAMPSVAIQNFGQGINFEIRGIGKGATNSATLTGVVTYRDGVATFPGYWSEEPYYDIDSLEVLRGPQGTFAGQNATGGAVFITEKNPVIDGGYHGYLEAQYGNYNDVDVQGAINLPISDTLAARVAFNTEHRDSFWHVTGPYSGDPGELNEASVRLSLLWQPTDALRVLFKTDYSYIDQGGFPSDPVLDTNSPFNITSNARWYAVDDLVRSVLDVNYKFPDDITLRAVTGFQMGRSGQKADLDGTDLLNETLSDGDDEQIWSEEINLISPSKGPLTWIAGLYYSNDQFYFPGRDGFDIGLPPGGEDIKLAGDNPKYTKAVFGQVSYKLVSGLELQVGARYSDFTDTNRLQTTIPEFGISVPQNQTEHDAKLTGKIALNWTINPDNFVYAFVATGHKGGGLNTQSTAVVPPEFKAEDVTDYEVGWKATAFNGHLKTQLGGYYNLYDNFQVQVGNPTNPIQSLELNVTSPTKIYGFEGTAQAVFGALSFDGGVSLLHSELGTFYADDPRNAGSGACSTSSGPATATCQNLTGRQQVYAPQATFNIGADYRFELAEGATLTPRINFGHISSQWSTIFEDADLGDRLQARNLLGAQVAYHRGEWLVTAYGTNLTNEIYYAAVNGGQRYAGPPRQFGLRLQKSF